MFKFVILAACVFASAQGGLLATPLLGATTYAAGPVLGAPLLGRTTITAPETTIVKQQVVVDQPEVHYRSVPTVVQTAPIVKTINPVVQQQVVQTYAAAAPVQTVQYAAAPVQTLQYAAAPVQTLQYAAAPALTYSAGIPAVQTVLGGHGLTYSAGIPTIGGFGYNYGGVTLLKK